MENIKNIIARLGPTGGLFLIGFILILYIAIGFLYFQQGAKQSELEEQIVKLSAVLTRPLTGAEELQAEYEECNRSLAPMTDTAAIATLVSIAEQSGIDVDEDSGKLRIPSATFSQAKVGGGTYQLISFKSIQVRGDYDNVMAFISNLDTGTTLKTMVLQKVVVNEVEAIFTGEERERRAEFRNVISAVEAMMFDNALLVMPNSMSFAGGAATNLMGDNPDTEGMVEGFPDITTIAAEKGYSGNATLRDGYVLYRHDRISTANTTQYETVSYLNTLTTKYYYTCEADGTVRQWDGPIVEMAREYLDSKESGIELEVTMDVDIYTKP